MTLIEIKEALGVTDIEGIKVYLVTMAGNPFTELSSHATNNLTVASIGGQVYAASTGTIASAVATEITE